MYISAKFLKKVKKTTIHHSDLIFGQENYGHNPSQSSVRCMATPYLRSLLNFIGIVVQVQSSAVHVNSKRSVPR